MFSGLRGNPYPVRAALQLGCDMCVTGTVARVDAQAPAIRDMLFHTEVHIDEPRLRPGPTAAHQSDHRQQQRQDVHAPCGLLDESTIANSTNALRKVISALGACRPTETSLLLMPPFDRVANAPALAHMWARELKCKVHLFRDVPFLRLRGGASDATGAASSSSPFDQLESCWFAAHVAAAKHLAPQRLLVLREASDLSALELVGYEPPPPIAECDTPAAASAASTAAQAEAQGGSLLRWAISANAPVAHRLLYERVQRRPVAVYRGVSHPVSPLHRAEVLALRELLSAQLGGGGGDGVPSAAGAAPAAVPTWVSERIAAGAVVVGSSVNGGTMNVCSRVAANVVVSLEKLEQITEFHYAGLSDTLLANYPAPPLVVAQACLLSALCRRLRVRRAEYLPEVAVTHAMLVQPSLWLAGQRAASSAPRAGTAADDAPPLVAAAQREFAYPHQAIDRYDPNKVRW